MVAKSANSSASETYLPYCYYSTEHRSELLKQPNILAIVDFTGQCAPSGEAKLFNTGLDLINQKNISEVWQSKFEVKAGIEDGCYWSTDNHSMFAGVWVEETTEGEYAHNIQMAYQKLLDLIQRHSYNQIARIWNYLPRINQGDGDQERYKQFCLGRQQAFESRGLPTQSYPAACAIGHQGSHTIIYLLAGKFECLHFENPRQISAYQYPRQYGPRSPSFARATLVDNRQIHLSGTASVIGYKTLYPGNTLEQLQVTLDNIDSLFKAIKTRVDTQKNPFLDCIKIYLREPTDYPQLTNTLAKHFDIKSNILCLKGDICRSELTLEIDGLASF